MNKQNVINTPCSYPNFWKLKEHYWYTFMLQLNIKDIILSEGVKWTKLCTLFESMLQEVFRKGEAYWDRKQLLFALGWESNLDQLPVSTGNILGTMEIY